MQQKRHLYWQRPMMDRFLPWMSCRTHCSSLYCRRIDSAIRPLNLLPFITFWFSFFMEIVWTFSNSSFGADQLRSSHKAFMAPVIAALMTESETAFLHTCLLSCRILLQMLLHPYYSIHLASILLDFIEICSLKGENIVFFNTRDRKKRCIQLSRHGFRDDSEDLLQELKRFWSSSLACLLKKMPRGVLYGFFLSKWSAEDSKAQ